MDLVCLGSRTCNWLPKTGMFNQITTTTKTKILGFFLKPQPDISRLRVCVLKSCTYLLLFVWPYAPTHVGYVFGFCKMCWKASWIVNNLWKLCGHTMLEWKLSNKVWKVVKFSEPIFAGPVTNNDAPNLLFPLDDRSLSSDACLRALVRVG